MISLIREVESPDISIAGARAFHRPAYNGSFKDKNVQFSRITIDPRQMGGVPCIRNLRIPVATVLDMVAEGMEASEILKAYPDLEAADIREALRFAAEAVRERELPLHLNG